MRNYFLIVIWGNLLIWQVIAIWRRASRTIFLTRNIISTFRLFVILSVATGYYLIKGTSEPIKIIAAIIWVLAITRFTRMIPFIVNQMRTIKAIKKSYESNDPSLLRLPYVYVGSSNIFDQRNLVVFLDALAECLWRIRTATDFHPISFNEDDELQDVHFKWEHIRKAWHLAVQRALWQIRPAPYRILVTFIVGEDINNCPPQFQDWIVLHASACITADNSILSFEFDDDIALALELGEQYSEETQKQKFKIAEFCRMVHGILGPVIALRGVEEPQELSDNPCAGYSVITAAVSGAKMERHNMDNFIAPVVKILSDTALPLFRADLRLKITSRQTIDRIPDNGIAPLADAYLRFRLATGDVERFLCLLDCFESMIRMCVILIIAERWKSGQLTPGLIPNLLKKPSIGLWIRALRELQVEGRAGSRKADDAILQTVSFWEERLAGVPKDLIDVTNGSGLNWNGEVPRTHIGWLDWLAWLRNNTKGHGTVDPVAPKWAHFHETMLYFVERLDVLTLSTDLVSLSEDGNSACLRGWLRAGHRNTPDIYPPMSKAEPHSLAFRWGAKRLLASPLLYSNRLHCLVWNKALKTGGEYVDYSSGALEDLAVKVSVDV